LVVGRENKKKREGWNFFKKRKKRKERKKKEKKKKNERKKKEKRKENTERVWGLGAGWGEC
jgi:hypothetical protein